MVNFLKNNLSDSTVRVNHAGEYAAVNIYKGQLLALKLMKSDLYEKTTHMLEQEEVHYDFFNKKIVEYRVRPTALMPLWKVVSFGLGFVTGVLGKNASLTCTVAVEEVIEEHYKDQLQHSDNFHSEEIHNAVVKFLADEIEHKDFAQKEGLVIRPLAHIIKLGCKLAIFCSKRF